MKYFNSQTIVRLLHNLLETDFLSSYCQFIMGLNFPEAPAKSRKRPTAPPAGHGYSDDSDSDDGKIEE